MRPIRLSVTGATESLGQPDIERVIREDLAEIMAPPRKPCLHPGAGTGEKPLGIKNTPGETPGPSFGTNGRTPTFDDLMIDARAQLC